MKYNKFLMMLVGLFAAILVSQEASALPTFARQTNLACSACHNGNYLALNSFGRNFKLTGYTMSTAKNIDKAGTESSPAQLSLPDMPGLSGMMQISTTSNHKNAANKGKQNAVIHMPQQLSLFLAGRLGDNMGVFSQFTLESGAGFGIDNTDIRYADATKVGGKNLDYGFSLDNNPTVGDLWNSTPAWGYPYSGSSVANGPSVADPFISRQGGAVAGLGAYGMLDNQFYGKFSLYRSEKANAVNVDASGNPLGADVISKVAPYWRFAWQKNIGDGYLMLGTYGLYAKVVPAPVATTTGLTGPTSKYLDTAVDFQYERPTSGENSIVAHGSYTREKRTDMDSGGAYVAGQNVTYKYSKLDMEYNLAGKFRPGVAVFNTSTGTDKLNATGYNAELSYFPRENVQLQALYTGYTKADGTTTGASANNSLYLLLWIMM